MTEKEWTSIAVTREQHREIVERKPDEQTINGYVMQAVRAKDNEITDLDELASELSEELDRGRLVGPQVLKKVGELEERVEELPDEVARRLRNY